MWPLTATGAEIFGLLLIRCLGFFVVGPIFIQRNIPARFKIMLALAIAIALFPRVSADPTPMAQTMPSFLFMVAGETFIGVILAFGVSIPFAGITMAAGLLGI